MARASLHRVRDICRDLPECEVEGDQHHRISVRGKTIGWHTVDHHGDGRVALTVKADSGDNEVLVAADPRKVFMPPYVAPHGDNESLVPAAPRKFFIPPYVARHGYVGIYLDLGDVDWDEVRELLTDAYRLVAPKRLAAPSRYGAHTAPLSSCPAPPR